MSEANLWRVVREALSPFGRLERIENGVGLGTPDVAYCLRRYAKIPQSVTGWIELKHLAAWPVRERTPITIEHLTREQANWATEWALAGGSYTCLLQVRHEYLFLDHLTVGALFAKQLNRATLVASSGLHHNGPFPVTGALKWLTKG